MNMSNLFYLFVFVAVMVDLLIPLGLAAPALKFSMLDRNVI